MAFPTFHPYRALLALFGQGTAPEIAVGGEPVTRLEPGLSDFHRELYQWFRNKTTLGTDRSSLYEDYDFMDCDDIISSALNLYAEDATQVDGVSGKTVWIESENKTIREIGNRLLETIGMEDLVFSIARGLAKYGDHFEALLVGLNAGRPIKILGYDYRAPHAMTRMEDTTGRLKGFLAGVQIEGLNLNKIKDSQFSQPWEFVHFRILGREERESGSWYGASLIRAARRVWRRLSMMEDALCIYRMRRAPDRLKWTIDVGDATPEEAAELINWYKGALRTKMLTDPATGVTSTEMDPLTIDEDIYIPVTEGSRTDVGVLAGSQTVGHVLDIEYMRKRLFSCLRIPPDYMGFSDSSGALAGRSPLADQDIQFARQEKRLQRAIMVGVIMTVKIELVVRGVDPELEENEFRACMCPVSFLDELQRAEVAKVRAAIVSTLLPLGKALKADEQTWISYVIKNSGLPQTEIAAAIEALRSPPDKRTLKDQELVEVVLRELAVTVAGSDYDRGGISSSGYPLKLTVLPERLEEAKE